MPISKLPIPIEKTRETLLAQKTITESDWENAKKNATRRRRTIEEVLIERGFFNEQFLYELVGDFLKIPYVNLRKIKLDLEILNLFNEKMARKVQAIPFALAEGKVKMAFVNPLDQDKLALAKETIKKEIIPKEIKDLAEKRQKARNEKDWSTSDKLRDKINSKGYEIKDSKEGYTITKK